MSVIKNPSKKSIFTRLSSLHKLLISLGIAAIVYLLIQIQHLGILTHVMIGWDTFCLVTIVLSWITFSVTTSQQIRELAKAQDSSRIIIFIIVLISTFASFLAVLLLIIAKNEFKTQEAFHLTVAIAGMVLSWILIHTIFTLRYAHVFYDNAEDQPEKHAAGLEFPGEKKPDYLDFAYFSFVLGMTFQVSDVQVTSKRFRRLVLLHGILAFGYNTIMIALTINLIAGFGN